uniref:Uncharacterized protein n=1 Tax=Oryza nivara TaxID=4536 RepID=A0A0E0GUB5_ORYNI
MAWPSRLSKQADLNENCASDSPALLTMQTNPVCRIPKEEKSKMHPCPPDQTLLMCGRCLTGDEAC